MGPLHGVRVLAVENFIAAPMATMWLADAGAEVVKVEAPGVGDQSRSVPPMKEHGETSRSLSFLRANRNKRSIALDLKNAADRAVFGRLVEKADIFVENVKPSSLTGLGLTYAELSQLNPRLIYAAVSGFGLPEFNEGDLPLLTSFDIVAQAMGGLMLRAEGSEHQPVYTGFPLADIFAASNLQSAIYQALYNRERTGVGACIDIAMLDGAVALNELSLIMYSATGKIASPGMHGLTAPFGAYLVSDGHVVIGVLGEPVWLRFTQAIGEPGLADVPEYATGVLRHRNRATLDIHINKWLSSRTTADVLEILRVHAVPAAPVMNVNQMLEFDYISRRGMIVTVDDPIWGPTRMAGNPLSSTLMKDLELAAPPQLGADSEAVLREWLDEDA